MKCVYVCGYGRSGSTLAGRMLSAQSGHVAVGEVTHVGSDSFLATAHCACGRKYPTCDYWAAVDRCLTAAAGPTALSRRARVFLEGLPGLIVPLTLLRRLVLRISFSDRYPQTSFADGVRLLTAVSGGGFVDISKTTRSTANRPRLLVASGMNVELHLAWLPLRRVVRSRQAAAMRQGRSASRGMAVVSVVTGRMLAHVAARRCAQSLRSSLPRVDLDEFIRLAAHVSEIDEQLNHMIAGNRSRRHGIDAQGE